MELFVCEFRLCRAVNNRQGQRFWMIYICLYIFSTLFLSSSSPNGLRIFCIRTGPVMWCNLTMMMQIQAM